MGGAGGGEGMDVRSKKVAMGAVLEVWMCLTLGYASQARGEPLWPDLTQALPTEGGGEADAAIIVGVEDYLMVPDVPGAVANANAWYAWFTRTRGLPVGSVMLLRDQEATREGMLSAVREMRGQVQPGGTLWFVFIGHGAPTKDGRDGVLVGIDTQQTADSVYARGLIQSELIDALSVGGQAETLLVLDACFSGQGSGGEALVENLQPMIPSYALQPGDVTVLTAGKANQFAGPLPGAQRPAFSYLLLGGLRGWAERDGVGGVTADEAIAYATDSMRVLIHGRAQTPSVVGPGGAMVLSRGTEQGPDLAAMVIEAQRRGTSGAHGSSGGSPEQLGSDADLIALAESSRAAREAEAALARAMEEEFEAAEASLRDEAEREWLEIEPQLSLADSQSVRLAEEYIAKYEDASVRVLEEARRVEIARVHDAQVAIGRATTASIQGAEAEAASTRVSFSAFLPKTMVDVRADGWTSGLSCRTPCELRLAPGSYAMEFMHGSGAYVSTTASLSAGDWTASAHLKTERLASRLEMARTFHIMGTMMGTVAMVLGVALRYADDDDAGTPGDLAVLNATFGIGAGLVGINLPLAIIFGKAFATPNGVTVRHEDGTPAVEELGKSDQKGEPRVKTGGGSP